MPARRLAIGVGLAVFLTLGFIGPGETYRNPNVLSRIALSFAILDEGSLRIDRLAPFLGDKAQFAGHFYSDKAPGVSLLALPVVAVVKLAFQLRGWESGPLIRPVAGGLVFSSRLIASVWWASALLSAAAMGVAATAMVRLGIRLGATPASATVAALAFAIATPAAGWGTTLFGHALAAALLLIGFARVLAASEAEERACFHDSAVAGFVLGLGLLVEFTNAAAVLVIAGFGAWRVIGRPRAGNCLTGAMLGGLAALLPLAIYNATAFGSPLHLAYADAQDFGAMRYGVFGIAVPQPRVVFELLAGAARGLLWISPFLVLAPFAYRAAARVLPGDVLAVLVLVPLCFLTLNAGYAYWDGGFSTGPRHLTAGLAFACLPFALFWERAGFVLRTVVEALLLASGVIALACASVDMVSPKLPAGHSPLLDHILPELLAGRVHNLLAAQFGPGLWTLAGLPFIWLAVALAIRVLPPARPAR